MNENDLLEMHAIAAVQALPGSPVDRSRSEDIDYEIAPPTPVLSEKTISLLKTIGTELKDTIMSLTLCDMLGVMRWQIFRDISDSSQSTSTILMAK